MKVCRDITNTERAACEARHRKVGAGKAGPCVCACCGSRVPWSEIRWWLDENGKRCTGHDCPKYPLPEMASDG